MLIALAAAASIVLAKAAPTPALAASPAPPAAAAAVPTPAAAPAKPKKPKMICEDEQSTDSFITKRVCRTAEQVEADRKAARGQVDRMADHLSTCRGPSC